MATEETTEETAETTEESTEETAETTEESSEESTPEPEVNTEAVALQAVIDQMTADHANAIAAKDVVISELRAELSRAIAALPNDSSSAVESTEETNEPVSWESLAGKATEKESD